LGPLSTLIFIRNKSRPTSGAKSSLRNTARIRIKIVVSLARLVVGSQTCRNVTKAGFASGGSPMWEGLGYLGLIVAVGYLIRVFAKAANDSGLEEFTLLTFRFKRNEKLPKQLNK